MNLYADPGAVSYPRSNLILGLMRQPTTVNVQPLENQLTESLAWLITRSDRFARAFVALFAENDDGLSQGAASVVRIGARTQLALPRPGGGTLFPDLSVDGQGRAFQLLVEVKVTSGFHDYDGLLQPAMYAYSWREGGEAGPARVRRVGTLAKETPAWDDEWKARDATWKQIRSLLEAELEPDVATVADDLAGAIDGRVLALDLAPSYDQLKSWLEQQRSLVEAIAQRFSAAVLGAGPPKAVQLIKDYVGTYVYFPTPAGDRCAWIYVTAANCRYNVLGYSDAAIIEVRKNGNEHIEPEWTSAILATGFELHTDLVGWKTPRRITPLETLEGLDASDAAEAVADPAVDALVEGGLVRPAHQPGV